MTTIFRVQNFEGYGPYRDKNNKCHIPHEMDDYRRHPTPTDDFEIFRDVYYRGADDILAFRELISEYRFGFPNRGMALLWFNSKMLEIVGRRGFYLMEVEGSDILVSDSGRQCIFRPIRREK